MENTSIEDQETIREFLVESHENLTRLDQDLVELEKHPGDANLLGSIFRTIHTIKGACGFLAFSVLEAITHQAETLLSQLRDGQRELTPALVSLILETVDATRKVLAGIETSGQEGPERFEDLTERLRVAAQLTVSTANHPRTDQLRPDHPPVAAAPVPAEQPVISQNSSALLEEGQPEEEGGEKREIASDERRKEGRREEDVVRPSAAVDSNIRVGVGLLDKLMDLVGELVLTRNQILQFNVEREDPALNATSQRLNLITTELQEGVMKTRMQPIGVVWNKLPRVVRDMSMTLGKQIHVQMDGAETELDRTIIEAIKDPLMHVIRNSCDHGIEIPEVRIRAGKPPQGVLTLRAYHEGGQVNIEIADDGAGIDVTRLKRKALDNGLLRPEQAEKLSDREALTLIFLPGFSTAKTVTNFSGRGVGMDVVKSHIEKIGGVVDVFSRLGEGTTVKIRIPLTLAIIPGLVITSGGERFVIPQVSLLELIRLEVDQSGKHIEYVHGTPVYRRRGSLLPIAYLNQVLGLKAADQTEALSMVVLQAEDRQFGLVVDGINDTQEIVVKPLGKQLKGLTLYAGRNHYGGWPRRPHPRCARHRPAFRGVSPIPGTNPRHRATERAIGNSTAAVAFVSGWLLRSFGCPAFVGRAPGGVPTIGHRACQRERGGAISQPDPALGFAAQSARTLRSRPRAASRSGTGGGFQRRRQQCGHGSRRDPGCHRRGSHGAPGV